MTTKTRYGAAVHYRQTITAGTTHDILLRLPVTWEAGLATYYRIAHLAGGRCGADSQRYTIHFDCTDFCGSGTRTVTREVDISQGTRPRIDIAF